MYGQTDDLAKAKERLNSVSPSFCMAKWMHSTLHLMNGLTHSCYLPKTHKIPLSELKENPAALHNTNFKKLQRKQMKCGKRPEECNICWTIEDLPGNQVSDRILRGTDSWTIPYFDQVTSMHWEENINPSYLEVSFSYLCNFKCSYCSPHVSSKWHEEIKKLGPYKLSENFQDVQYLEKEGLMPIADEDNNLYIKAFWEWWPTLYPSLKIFRITGGEPLLSKHTFKILEWIDRYPSNISLDINSNLGVPDKVFFNFLDTIKPILDNGKVQSLSIHTSVDNYGSKAEYIRSGLKFEKFEKNINTYLEMFPNGGLAFMCTFNALSVDGFDNFLKWYRKLRATYERTDRQIYLDIPHLMTPRHLCAQILTPDYADRVLGYIQLMKDLEFRPMEIEKLRRIHSWMTQPKDEAKLKIQRKDFYDFIVEFDKRRGHNFLDIFPDMKDFYLLCQSISHT